MEELKDFLFLQTTIHLDGHKKNLKSMIQNQSIHISYLIFVGYFMEKLQMF